MSGERSERRRWTIAALLNRLPKTCNASLVDWALRRRPLWDRLDHDDIRQNWMCREASNSGRCYCGKLAVEKREANS